MEHPEDDGPSSAASCIQFTIDYNDDTAIAAFQPVYTHQIFPGERIPGYRPYLTLPLQKEQHPSFQYSTMHELLIRIRMVPSCKTCSVAVFTQLRDRSAPPTHLKKRLREGDEEGDAVSTNSAILSLDQIVERLGTYLPPITDILIHENATDIPILTVPSRSESNLPNDATFLSKPFGTVLREYQQGKNAFVISLCDGPDCIDYHSAVQKWAWYFIETAEDVNINDPSWKVLYLFRKHDSSPSPQYSLAGYITLYSFVNPFRKPKPGTILRICQAVVLPHYQRLGHGARLYHAIYDHVVVPGEAATASLLPIVEVNVEDPAPAFSHLRLLVDYERYLGRTAPCFDPDGTPRPEAQEQTPTTTQQLQRVYEIDQLQQLLLSHPAEWEDDPARQVDPQDAPWKRFRLSIKRRLHQEHHEELPEDKTEQKRRLEERYQQVVRQYRKILRKARVPGNT
jgi:histone acetyltransferase 1